MSGGGLLSFAALRAARMLKENAPPAQIDSYVAQMLDLARRHGDAAREAFWQDVAILLVPPPVSLPQSGQKRRSGAGRG
jgi:hypothetical protein